MIQMDKVANRREQILEAAVYVFAHKGYFKATTADVAKHAKISQPYVYNFFTSKEELLLAALKRAMERIVEAFSAISSTSERVEEEMISAYEGLMSTHKEEILLQVQALAIREPEVQRIMREGLIRIKDHALIKFKEAGIEAYEQRAADFVARGMLCNAALALETEELIPRNLMRKK